MGGPHPATQARQLCRWNAHTPGAISLLQAHSAAKQVCLPGELLQLRKGAARTCQAVRREVFDGWFQSQPVSLREVLFIDTDDFRLYNNAFILRRRILYKDGFPVSDPEIVFKFRHPDMQMCADTDVRPRILGDHRVKFKCQAMPLKEKLGGIRMLFSHNVQFQRSAIGMGKENVRDMDQLVDLLPALGKVRKNPKEPINLVSNTIIEEVLQDIGMLDFGEGLSCKANVAIWRTRGEHRPLIGEFAYQFKFQDRNTLSKEAMKRAEAFFIALQYSAEDYIALNCTKTATVYRLLGNPPKSHE